MNFNKSSMNNKKQENNQILRDLKKKKGYVKLIHKRLERIIKNYKMPKRFSYLYFINYLFEVDLKFMDRIRVDLANCWIKALRCKVYITNKGVMDKATCSPLIYNYLLLVSSLVYSAGEDQDQITCSIECLASLYDYIDRTKKEIDCKPDSETTIKGKMIKIRQHFLDSRYDLIEHTRSSISDYVVFQTRDKFLNQLLDIETPVKWLRINLEPLPLEKEIFFEEERATQIPATAEGEL